MTTTEENKALFRRTYEELLNGGDLSVADELVAPEFVNHEAPPGTRPWTGVDERAGHHAANGFPRPAL
jgi:ketosteroid isomerase-like protein